MLHRSIALLLATGAVTSAFTTPSASVKPSHASNFGKRIISHRISASISEDGLEFADDVDRTTETILDASEMLIDPTGALAEALPPMVEIDGATQTLFAEPPAVETDVAKDLVLDAISGTTPDMFDTEAAAFMNTEGAAIQTEKRGLDAEKRGLDALLTEDLSQTKAIETILAVSQQAAEAAEATLDDAVSDSIPLIPPRQFNDTVGSMPEILPAKDVVGTPATSKESFDYPSVRRIMTFAASATGVFLCSPLLSLIDTSAVGLLSGTAQQAALNPAIAVSDYAALLIAFLYTGATNLVAAAQEKDRGVEGKPVTTKSFSTALQLSTYVGAALGSFLFVFARPLLKALIGNDSIAPEVFNAAMKYVRIRALGMPAAAIIGSAQAGCLGMQDVKSPLYVLAAAAIVNLFGDLIFVGMKNPMFGGAAGAAWATMFSQYTAVWFFTRWLCTKPKGAEKKAEKKTLNISNNILELTGENKSKGIGRRHRFSKAVKSFTKYTPGKSLASKVSSATQKLRKRPSKKVEEQQKHEEVSTRGFLAGKFSGADLAKFPNRQRAKEFAPYFLPVTTTQVGRVSSYIAMSHVVASTLGTAAMASQQVIVALFYCLTPMADSLSLTAQSVVPGLVEKKHSKARAAALKKTMINFFKAGGIFGSIMVSAVLCIPFLSQFFTADASVRALVNSVIPMLIAFFSVHGICMSSEGLMLAQKDLNFVGQMYGAFFFAVPYFMLRVKRAGLAGNHVTLTSVWSIFAVYQLVRSAAFLARNLTQQRRANIAGAKADEAQLL